MSTEKFFTEQDEALDGMRASLFEMSTQVGIEPAVTARQISEIGAAWAESIGGMLDSPTERDYRAMLIGSSLALRELSSLDYTSGLAPRLAIMCNMAALHGLARGVADSAKVGHLFADFDTTDPNEMRGTGE